VSAPRGMCVMALAVVGVLGVAMAPLPPVMFDLLIGISLCLAALTFLVAFYVERPTEFSSFPSLLLFVTLFRLALNVEQSFDGDTAGAETTSFVIALAGYLTQNSLERARIEAIDIRLAQSAKPRSATLVDAHADRTVVRPGDRVTVSLDLLPYRGERYRHSVAVPLPEDLPDGRYSLLVGDGASADATRLLLQPAEPLSFGQALTLLRSFHSRRDLVVMGVFGGSGLSVAGEAMPRLPASVRSLWGAAASGSAVPLRLAIAQQQVERLAAPIDGLVKIDLEVRRREPLPAGQTEGGAGGGNKSEPGKAPEPQAAPAVTVGGEVAGGGR